MTVGCTRFVDTRDASETTPSQDLPAPSLWSRSGFHGVVLPSRTSVPFLRTASPDSRRDTTTAVRGGTGRERRGDDEGPHLSVDESVKDDGGTPRVVRGTSDPRGWYVSRRGGFGVTEVSTGATTRRGQLWGTVSLAGVTGRTQEGEPVILRKRRPEEGQCHLHSVGGGARGLGQEVPA